jgi:hypothetical protein
MWIMTTYGAFSVVARDPKHTDEGDDRTMVVRARREEWLTELRKRAMPELGPSVHYAGADYQYHAAIAPEDLARGVARIALDAASYRNFKSATLDPAHGLKSPSMRHGLHDAYSKIWSTLLAAGDGTSMYDGHQTDAGTIDVCARLGHYYSLHGGKCSDCGTPRPADVKGSQGPKATAEEVEAWWKSRGGRKATRRTRKPAATKTAAPAGAAS